MVIKYCDESDLPERIEGVINRLRELLFDDLRLVETELTRSLRSDLALLDEVGRWLMAAPGKRLRPMITLLAERCFRPESMAPAPALFRVAAAMELVHTATLLHDDVIDHSMLRRGRETVNARWGNEVAILVADWIFSEVFATSADVIDKTILTLIARATSNMCEGEISQIERCHVMFTPDDYFFVAERKTAVLFSTCAAVGAHMAGATAADIDAMGGFGKHFGLLFQVTDDLLDFAPTAVKTGKPHMADLINRKQSLPIVLAYGAASDGEKKKFMTLWNNAAAPVEELAAFVKAHNGVELARERARALMDETREILRETAPPSTSRKLLDDVTQFTLSRQA